MTSSKQFITTFGKSFPLFRLFLSVFFEPSPLPLGVEGEKKMVNRREEKRRRGGGVWGRRIRLLIIIIFFLSLVYFGVSRVKMTEEDWLKIQGQVGFGAESCASLRYFSSLMEKGEGDPFVAPFVPDWKRVYFDIMYQLNLQEFFKLQMNSSQPGMMDHLLHRFRLSEEIATKFVSAHRKSQIIILGSGFNPLPLRLFSQFLRHKVEIFDIDYLQVQEKKIEALKNANFTYPHLFPIAAPRGFQLTLLPFSFFSTSSPSSQSFTQVPKDLRVDWELLNCDLQDKLNLVSLPFQFKRAGFNPALPTLILAEGVFPYFSPTALNTLLSHITSLWKHSIPNLPSPLFPEGETCLTNPFLEPCSFSSPLLHPPVYLFFDSLSSCPTEECLKLSSSTPVSLPRLFFPPQFGVGVEDKMLEGWLRANHFLKQKLWSSFSTTLNQTKPLIEQPLVEGEDGGKELKKEAGWAYFCLAQMDL